MTNSITTSQRFYKESFLNPNMHKRMQTIVPVGCAKFRWDLFNSIDWAIKDVCPNLIHSTYHADGGHFAAMQLPKVLFKDFIDFVKKVPK